MIIASIELLVFSIFLNYKIAWPSIFVIKQDAIISCNTTFNLRDRFNKIFQVQVETFIRVKSFVWACLLSLWLVVFSAAAKVSFMKDFLLAYPGLCSFGMFKDSGPTAEQANQFPNLIFNIKFIIAFAKSSRVF